MQIRGRFLTLFLSGNNIVPKINCDLKVNSQQQINSRFFIQVLTEDNRILVINVMLIKLLMLPDAVEEEFTSQWEKSLL